MTKTLAQNLFPAPPNEQRGWGRCKRILRDYSTAPMELKLGFGSVCRGLWAAVHPGPPPDPHTFYWDSHIPLSVWGLVIAVLGFMQFFGCLYRWERMRTWAASLLAGSMVYITGKYILHDAGNIATVLYGTLLVGEVWIALRGWPVFGGAPMNGRLTDDV